MKKKGLLSLIEIDPVVEETDVEQSLPTGTYDDYLGSYDDYLSSLGTGQQDQSLAINEPMLGEQADVSLSADLATIESMVLGTSSNIITTAEPTPTGLDLTALGATTAEMPPFTASLVTAQPYIADMPHGVLPQTSATVTPDLTGDFYVAVDGNDKGAGTITDPFASIEKAISVAGAGDVILVRGGTYEGRVNIWNGGEPGAELLIKAYSGEVPVIDGSGTPAGTDLVVISASNVVFSGFEVMNSQKAGIAVWSSENVTISDNIVHTAQQGGIWIGSDKLGTSSGHVIEGNAVFNTGLSNQELAVSEGWPRAIGIDVSTDTIVRDNHVFENYGEGVGARSSVGVDIVGNYVYDNYSVQIYLDNVQDVVATDNFVFHTFEEEFYRNGEPGIGILIANEHTDFEMATSGLLITGNTYVGVETAFYDGSYGWGGGMSDSTIANETILTSGSYLSDWLWI